MGEGGVAQGSRDFILAASAGDKNEVVEQPRRQARERP
eukprot:CAMPEP_0180147844 /NCGR_PEP_ID=MMETSP0986-20121125/19573_1 /TAXON_ID=697907 /ORGANISM="non described non described, Strain CCMP2293" /LENGTH=37 /DNA_ID= /DNA_START= /DNA_END= /DNA_ORIENTATION=